MSIPPKKILLAIDGYEGPSPAMRTAVELANTFGAELHVVHVGILYYGAHFEPMSPGQLERFKETAQLRLDNNKEEVEKMGGGVTQSHLRLGDVDGEVLRLSDELAVDMVIIGSRKQSAASRILLGNDAESIVRHAPCSVLVVRQED